MNNVLLKKIFDSMILDQEPYKPTSALLIETYILINYKDAMSCSSSIK